jgi:hypothetical protein
MPQTLAADTVRDLGEQFAAEGFAVARQLLTPDEIALIGTIFMDQAQGGPVEGLSEIRHLDTPRYTDKDPLRHYPRMMQPHLHPDKPVGPVARRYMLDPRFHVLLKACIGAEPLAVQTMFYFKPPGARGQALHQDNFYLRVKPGTCVAAWIAVDDADEENGGMVVVPGSHDMDIVCPDRADPCRFFTTEHVPVPAGLRERPVPLKAGDVLFFNGSLIHGSYPNTSSNRFRRSLIAHYVPEGTTELSHWYRFPTRFDGTEVNVPQATGGGPCGTAQTASAPH